MKNSRPNIILVTLHDLGRQIDAYDPELPPTPNIRRLAEEGLVFESHFTTCPLCSPARASIQTGRYPHSTGMNGLTHRGFALNENERCLPHYLNDAGYHTALYGLQHEVHEDAARLGYREMHTKPQYSLRAAEVMPDAARFLKGKPREPFFLAIGLKEVHRDFQTHGVTPVDPSRVKVPAFLPDCPPVREDLAYFYGMAQNVERGMEVLLSALDRTGLAKNTLLLFTTDHGFAFPRAKSTLYDPGIGVTLLARWPEALRAGVRVRGMTSHVDILPTILELAGVKGAEAIQGRSFLAQMLDPSAPGREVVFAEKSWHGNEYDPMRCVRTERYKYIRNFTKGFLYQNPTDIRQSPSGQVVEPQRGQPRAMEELYDLRADPGETRNLVEDSTARDVLADLRARLDQWMRETVDPLPERHIPFPHPEKEHFLNNMLEAGR